MKVNPKFLIMMAALATGTAHAASAGTSAGTVITNVASASYTDPVTGNPILTPIPSNSVNTTVTAITGFDVVYGGGEIDDKDVAGAPSTYKEPNALPGGTVVRKYTVNNNSNIEGYRVNLVPVTTGGLPTAAPTGGLGGVQYFLDLNNDGVADSATAINFVTLTNNGTSTDSVRIVQVITIPTGATIGTVYSATPQGFAPAGGTAPATYLDYLETTNQNMVGMPPVSTPSTNGDLQPTVATVSTPKLTIINPPTIPGYPLTPTPTTPTVPTPGTPSYPPVAPPGGNSTYVSPTTPIYPIAPTTPVTPNNPGTVVVLNGGNQAAYPKADGNAANDVVTFVSNVQNDGPLPDTIYVKPPALPAGATSVQLLDKNGEVLVAGTGPNAGRFLIPGTVAPGDSAQYQVVVTYPDSDSLPTQASIVTPIEIFSGNVPTAPAKTNTFTIYPPQMEFGDTTATQGADAPKVETQKVLPNGTFATNKSSTSVTDSTAVFPMDVANNGQYSDSYVLEASVPTLSGAVVTYYYESAPGTFSLVPTATSGPDNGKQVTPVVPAGTELKVYAVVDVALATTAGDYLVSQKATGVYSTIVKNDDNDIIRVSPLGQVGVAKFVAKASVAAGSATVTTNNVTNNGVTIFNPANFTPNATDAAPKTNISYRIIAKNTYNTAAVNFILSDTVPTNTTFVSVLGSSTLVDNTTSAGTTIYSINGTAWTLAAPTTGTTFYVALDDATMAGEQPGALPSGAKLEMEFTVKVN